MASSSRARVDREPPVPGTTAPPAEMMAAFAAFWAQWEAQHQGLPEMMAAFVEMMAAFAAFWAQWQAQHQGPVLESSHRTYHEEGPRHDDRATPHRTRDSSHPFTERLYSGIIPKDVLSRISALPTYTGGDPSQHVYKFMSALLGTGAKDDHFALLFPSTLLREEASMIWFHNLPPASIDSWAQLRHKFQSTYFM